MVKTSLKRPKNVPKHEKLNICKAQSNLKKLTNSSLNESSHLYSIGLPDLDD